MWQPTIAFCLDLVRTGNTKFFTLLRTTTGIHRSFFLETYNKLTSVSCGGHKQVDAKPLKQALATWASKWVYLFTHYLQEKVVNSVEELYVFMNNTNEVLDKKVNSLMVQASPTSNLMREVVIILFSSNRAQSACGNRCLKIETTLDHIV